MLIARERSIYKTKIIYAVLSMSCRGLSDKNDFLAFQFSFNREGQNREFR